MREFTDDEKFSILDMGALNYDIEKCSLILEIAIEDLKESAEFKRLIDRGALLYKFNLSRKLMELAQKGDLKAIDMIEKQKTRK